MSIFLSKAFLCRLTRCDESSTERKTSPKDRRIALGKKGEKLTEKFLKKKGYRTLRRNMRRRTGEIDLLMQHNDELVIVEVRTVKHLGKMDAVDRVPYSKQKQLVRMAKYVESEYAENTPPIRFDVCVVVMEPETEIHHFPDAFRPDRL